MFDEGIAGLLERAIERAHTATASTQIKAGFISLTPNVSYNGYWNFAALDKGIAPDVPDSVVTDTLRGFYTDGDWRLGISANTKFYGTFNVRGDRRLQAIRHVITPPVGFSYNPAFDRPTPLSAWMAPSSKSSIRWPPVFTHRPTSGRRGASISP